MGEKKGPNGSDKWKKYLSEASVMLFGDKDALEVDDMMEKKYNPSHRGFYPQFFKGLRCAWFGLVLTKNNDSLKRKVTQAIPLTVGFGGMLFIALLGISNLSTTLYELLFPVDHRLKLVIQYANYISLLTVFFLDKKVTSEDVYFEAVSLRNADFAKAVSNQPRIKNHKVKVKTKARRFARMMTLRIVAKLIKSILPRSIQRMALPVLRVGALRPVLGTGVSIVVAVADFFPSEGSWDEVVLLVSEALIDSYSFGRELLDPYVKRLEYETGRYFLKRYHGYITGTGLVFGLLARIPLLSSACLIAGESAAAELTLRIVGINQTKSPRMELLGEEVVMPIDSTQKDRGKKVR